MKEYMIRTDLHLLLPWTSMHDPLHYLQKTS